ncbi:MAG: endonuclease NucS domain-containing protein, partial [Candidatus Angelobacter sp.]
MGTEIKVWQLTNGELHEIEADDLSATYREKDLEEWIERDPSLLGSKLLVIGRQYDIPNVGRLDLLCVDETGTLVLVEFKRNLTNRETVAQVLDYASWLDAASEAEI